MTLGRFWGALQIRHPSHMLSIAVSQHWSNSHLTDRTFVSSLRTPPHQCNSPEPGHGADDFHTILMVLHCWYMFISPVSATVTVSCSGTRVATLSWALGKMLIVSSCPWHQELLENIYCPQSDAGYFYLHMRDIFHLFLPNLPIPSCGYLGEGRWCFSSSKSLVVDPQNLQDGSLCREGSWNTASGTLTGPCTAAGVEGLAGGWLCGWTRVWALLFLIYHSW